MSFVNPEPLSRLSWILLAVIAAGGITVVLDTLKLIDLHGFALPLLMMPLGLMIYEQTQARKREQAGADEE